MNKKQIRIRCWIEIDGERFFGPGPAALLDHISTEGSISRAAKRMSMSYKKAWDIVDNLNANSNTKLVRITKGGAHGGSAEVTKHGKEVVAAYQELSSKLNKVLERNQGLIRRI